jgi:hypothetical protein
VGETVIKTEGTTVKTVAKALELGALVNETLPPVIAALERQNRHH